MNRAIIANIFGWKGSRKAFFRQSIAGRYWKVIKIGKIKMKIWINALLILATIIVAIQISAYTATGTWHNKFAVQSMSMEPNMHRGDLILIQSLYRTNIITYEFGGGMVGAM